MREYRQLTEEDRIEIYAMKQAGKERNMIAAELAHKLIISQFNTMQKVRKLTLKNFILI